MTEYLKINIRLRGELNRVLVTVPANGSVHILRKAVESAFGFPPDSQQLILSGKLLELDDSLLASYTIRNGDTVLVQEKNPLSSSKIFLHTIPALNQETSRIENKLEPLDAESVSAKAEQNTEQRRPTSKESDNTKNAAPCVPLEKIPPDQRHNKYGNVINRNVLKKWVTRGLHLPSSIKTIRGITEQRKRFQMLSTPGKWVPLPTDQQEGISRNRQLQRSKSELTRSVSPVDRHGQQEEVLRTGIAEQRQRHLKRYKSESLPRENTRNASPVDHLEEASFAAWSHATDGCHLHRDRGDPGGKMKRGFQTYEKATLNVINGLRDVWEVEKQDLSLERKNLDEEWTRVRTEAAEGNQTQDSDSLVDRVNGSAPPQSDDRSRPTAIKNPLAKNGVKYFSLADNEKIEQAFQIYERTTREAIARLRDVWEAEKQDFSPEWRDLEEEWSRVRTEVAKGHLAPKSAMTPRVPPQPDKRQSLLRTPAGRNAGNQLVNLKSLILEEKDSVEKKEVQLSQKSLPLGKKHAIRKRPLRRSGISMEAVSKQWIVGRETRELTTVHKPSFAAQMGCLDTLSDRDDESRQSSILHMTDEFRVFFLSERRLEWLRSFRCLDPRYMILTFFNDVTREGAGRIEEADQSISKLYECSPLLQYFSKASAFSVWRPTSNDSIRKMIIGEGTGKGLDVKGKSARKGILSGFIPFVQIHEESHKREIRRPPKDGMMRIFYKNEAARNIAVLELTYIYNKMAASATKARAMLSDKNSDEDQRVWASSNLVWASSNLLMDVADPKIQLLDDYSPLFFGVNVAQRIFFEAYIMKQDIGRGPIHDTGRPSEPAFQDMNFKCVRDYSGDGPRSVVVQLSEAPTNALRPQELVVAYEEHGKIVPVVSDFDCFLVGTRSLDYSTPLPESQIRHIKDLLAQIEGILDSPITSESWTKRWLEVLKQVATNNTIPTMPQFGFGDPKSYAIMENVVSRLKRNGAVRHGAESFNYAFPQELDESFLVIDERLDSKVPWKYVGVQELRELLCARIDEGYVFPLNPKWILADHGWKAVYDKMMSSTNERVKRALAVWYPPESGIRELIEDIHSRFPDGFQRLSVENGDEDDKLEGTEGWDLARHELQRHIVVRRAKLKLKCALVFIRMLSKPHEGF